MAEIKEEFKENISGLDYLINEFKKELKRTAKGYKGEYRSVRKERLNRLRLEINSLLLDIENNYGCSNNDTTEYVSKDI